MPNYTGDPLTLDHDRAVQSCGETTKPIHLAVMDNHEFIKYTSYDKPVQSAYDEVVDLDRAFCRVESGGAGKTFCTPLYDRVNCHYCQTLIMRSCEMLELIRDTIDLHDDPEILLQQLEAIQEGVEPLASV